MAGHLRVEANRYDIPTMADMYVASFGRGELRDLLRGMLPDHDLEAGPAHLALGHYHPEAVITTNFLDTLLDGVHPGGRRWNCVVNDADLSASTKTLQSTGDLIYFHGHRSASDSWVMTRSQYEDVAQRAPVMVARVRQLIAQHPILIVGFGLSDPNFHNVYRRIGAEMRGHQPQGLSIQLASVSEAERRHWFDLGIRIAAPKDGATLRGSGEKSNEFFVWLFKQLSTSWSPDQDAVLDHVREAAEPNERFARLRGLLPQQWELRPEVDHFEEQSDRFSAWKKVLFSFVTPQIKAAATDAADKAASANVRATRLKMAHSVATATGSASAAARVGAAEESTVEEAVAFQALPEWTEFERTDSTTWQLDGVLKALRLDAATSDHFILALDLGLFETDGAEQGFIPWVPLTFWLAVQAKRPVQELAALAAKCLDTVARYGDEKLAAIIRREAECAEVAVPEPSNKPTAAAPGPMEQLAFQAALDGNHGKATCFYRKAADRALGENRKFEEWAWRIGELHSLRDERDSRLKPTTNECDDVPSVKERQQWCRARIAHLEDTRMVQSWLKRARNRIRRVQEYALERRETRAQFRATGGTGFSSSNSMHMAWRSFHDLEMIHAPPTLQDDYLVPLLLESGFSPDVELGYRMVFDVKGTKEWLTRTIDAPSASLEKQAARDASLMKAFWEKTRTAHSVSERTGQLLAVRGLRHAFRAEDIDLLREWLPVVRQALGTSVRTYNATRSLDGDYANALRLFADFGRCEDVRRLFDDWSVEMKGFGPYEFAGSLLRFPWFKWAITEPDHVANWLDALASSGLSVFRDRGDAKAGTRVRMGDDSLVFAVYTMLAEL